MRDAKGAMVGVVGPCSAGKTTLAEGLRARGYRVKEIRQEHSRVPDMWQRITKPDLLIYVDVSMAEGARREGLDKPSSWWGEEREFRLAHARAHCDLYVDSTGRTPAETLAEVLAFLERNV